MTAPAGTTDPAKIKKLSPQELMIQWRDGHESHYVGPVLRGLCPCATCQDENTGQRLILPIHIPDTLEFRKIELVGQYALQFEWSDGHGTGIYSFDRLRESSPFLVETLHGSRWVTQPSSSVSSTSSPQSSVLA